jgi:hypothetical protein
MLFSQSVSSASISNVWALYRAGGIVEELIETILMACLFQLFGRPESQNYCRKCPRDKSTAFW